MKRKPWYSLITSLLIKIFDAMFASETLIVNWPVYCDAGYFISCLGLFEKQLLTHAERRTKEIGVVRKY